MENPNFYAVIPANVRYDKTLTPNAKLLYGEITALCNDKGFCWAGNQYFAELYNVSKVSISKWIKQLQDLGYVKTEIIYKEGTKEILHRYIRIVIDPIKENFNTPIKEKFKENTTISNITFNNNINNISEKILMYLNRVLNSDFKPVKSNLMLIEARLKEGYTKEDICEVINKKYEEWYGTDFEKYLRPSTLFNATKFANYHGQKKHEGVPF